MLNVDKKILLLDDFADLDMGQERFVVDPIIPAQGIVLCHGKRAHGKTQFATSLALAVGAGGLFMQRYEVDQGRVLMIQVDTPPMILQERYKRLRGSNGAASFGVMVHVKPFNVVEVAESEPWVQAAKEFNPTMVIIDSLRKTHRLPENDSDTPSLVYAHWRRLLGIEPTLFFLHHDRKTPTTEGWRPSTDEEFRGSGAWLDDCDTGIHIVQERGKGGSKRIVCYFSKLRTCEDQEPISMVMDSETLLLLPQGELTPLDKAKQIIYLNPKIEPADLVKALVAQGVPKSTAHKLIVAQGWKEKI